MATQPNPVCLLSVTGNVITLLNLDFKFNDATKNYSITIQPENKYAVTYVEDDELKTITGTVKSISTRYLNNDGNYGSKLKEKEYFIVVDCSSTFKSELKHIQTDNIRDIKVYKNTKPNTITYNDVTHGATVVGGESTKELKLEKVKIVEASIENIAVDEANNITSGKITYGKIIKGNMVSGSINPATIANAVCYGLDENGNQLIIVGGTVKDGYVYAGTFTGGIITEGNIVGGVLTQTQVVDGKVTNGVVLDAIISITKIKGETIVLTDTKIGGGTVTGGTIVPGTVSDSNVVITTGTNIRTIDGITFKDTGTTQHGVSDGIVTGTAIGKLDGTDIVVTITNGTTTGAVITGSKVMGGLVSGGYTANDNIIVGGIVTGGTIIGGVATGGKTTPFDQNGKLTGIITTGSKIGGLEYKTTNPDPNEVIKPTNPDNNLAVDGLIITDNGISGVGSNIATTKI